MCNNILDCVTLNIMYKKQIHIERVVNGNILEQVNTKLLFDQMNASCAKGPAISRTRFYCFLGSQHPYCCVQGSFVVMCTYR